MALPVIPRRSIDHSPARFSARGFVGVNDSLLDGLPVDPNDHDAIQERYEDAVENAGSDDCERCAELQALLDDMRAELAVAGVVFDA